MKETKEILKVEGLSKTFKLSAKQQKIEKTNSKTITAVQNLSFSAYEGEIFGLLGPNGAGKTTTLRMLATLIKPNGGDAFIDGSSIVNSPDEVRGKIGFLTSELKLEDFFTPNFLFDFFSDLHKVPDEIRDKRKAELFEKFGIPYSSQSQPNAPAIATAVAAAPKRPFRSLMVYSPIPWNPAMTGTRPCP